MTTIIVTPRIHVGLISMHQSGYRKNGGIGFSIRDPETTIELVSQPKYELKDYRKFPMGTAERKNLHELVDEILATYSFETSVCVTIKSDARDHVGLGMGTALRLGIIEGLFNANRYNIDRATLVDISQRGGTSGVGINTYFSGGLIMDLGITNDGTEFTPSSQKGKKKIPLKLTRVTLPQWPLCICVPKYVEPKTQLDEVKFFRSVTPVSAAHSYDACYHALFGVYSSLVERDFNAFCKSIEFMQQTEWKRKEWAHYGSNIFNLAIKLRRYGAQCVGMSSLGPLVYCFGSKDQLDLIYNNACNLDCDIIRTRFCNAGRKLSTA